MSNISIYIFYIFFKREKYLSKVESKGIKNLIFVCNKCSTDIGILLIFVLQLFYTSTCFCKETFIKKPTTRCVHGFGWFLDFRVFEFFIKDVYCLKIPKNYINFLISYTVWLKNAKMWFCQITKVLLFVKLQSHCI